MKKTFCIIGMIISLLICILGVLQLFHVEILGDIPYYATGVMYKYDHGYAQFGADFYSHVNNNTADAAQSIHRAVTNQIAIYDILNVILAAMGLLSFFFFGVKLGETMGPEEAKASAKYTVPTEAIKPGPMIPVNQRPSESVAEELKGLKEMLDCGVLTQEEYSARKRQLLGS